MKYALRIAAATALVWAICACSSPNYSYVTAVRSHDWTEPAKIAYDNSDTTSINDIELILRYDNRLQYDAVPLQIKVIAPDSTLFEEHRTIKLCRTQTAAARRMVDVAAYRTGARLAQQGRYIFEIMPLAPLTGVEAVGVNIKPTR